MKSIFRFFAERHTLANVFTIMIIILGVSALTFIRRDQFPKDRIDEMLLG